MNDYQNRLKLIMDEYVHFVYWITKNFPQSEIYGSTSQFRRATLSIVLNYIEGYARIKPLLRLNFLETYHGSFKESKYLLYFSLKEKYITGDNYNSGMKLADEIGAMLWKEIENLDKNIKK